MELKENDYIDIRGDLSFSDLMQTLGTPNKPVRFPYDEYEIVGDKSEIERIIYASGIDCHANIDVWDIMSTLSEEAANYISTGISENDGDGVKALKDALSKLPIEPNYISKLLFNVWVPKDKAFARIQIGSVADFIKGLKNESSTNFKIIWGCAFDDSLEEEQVKVSLIAASK